MILQNLASWSLQVTVLILAGALLPAVCCLRLPRARLLCWQVLLVACLLLPLLEPWQRPAARASISFARRTPVVAAGEEADAAPFPMTEAVLAALAAGLAIRGIWLALGFCRLRRYRDTARRIEPLPAALQSIEERLGVAAEFAISDEISSPITFGLRRPIVLLPPGFVELAPLLQKTVACHELLHVRRRDWAFTVFEECVRAVLWFHPAIWWLLGNIQLAREQAVDGQVIALTRSRDSYVEALLAIASARPQLDLAPAPLFLRKRHLAQRVAAILEEVTMSKRQLISSLASVFAFLALAGWLAVSQFPLRAMPQQDAPGVSVKEGGLKLLHRAPVVYPAEAQRKGIAGVVVLELDVNADGNVTDARVLSGPVELRKAALQSVLQWHYAKDGAALPTKTQVSVDFNLPPVSATPAKPRPHISDSVILNQIDVDSLPDSLRENLRAKLAPFVGQALSDDVLAQIENEAHAADEHLTISGRGGTLKLTLPPTGGWVVPVEAQRIRVGGNVQQRLLIAQPKPVYPPEAKQAGLEGPVKFTAVIGKDGTIQKLDVIEGDPVLVKAAADAVKNWVYKPTLLNGNPVEVVTQIDVNFTLSR